MFVCCWQGTHWHLSDLGLSSHSHILHPIAVWDERMDAGASGGALSHSYVIITLVFDAYPECRHKCSRNFAVKMTRSESGTDTEYL